MCNNIVILTYRLCYIDKTYNSFASRTHFQLEALYVVGNILIFVYSLFKFDHTVEEQSK